MDILEWINVGKVAAERDDLLSEYFFDNGVLAKVIGSPSSFLVLGRKGAGKTAVFKYLSESAQKFIDSKDILVSLSFEDYNWNIHSLLLDEKKAESLAYKQSWKLVILIESIKAYKEWFVDQQRKMPKELNECCSIIEKIFGSPVPSIYHVIGKKILSLSKINLPKAGLSAADIELDCGDVSFQDIQESPSLKQHLSENIEHLIDFLDSSLQKILITEDLPIIYLCFDRIDEAWDGVSYEASKKVIAGLVSASDSITSQYKENIRPIIFLREDIFDVLNLNDANKLREDCGALLHWDKSSLASLLLRRINYFAKQKNVSDVMDLDNLFDRHEMRQRTKPTNYLLKRTMMRPRDLISIMGRIIETMKEKQNDPFNDDVMSFTQLEAESIYAAEPGYSEWLKKEIIDEWAVQKPIIVQLLNSLQNNGSTNFTKEALEKELMALDVILKPGEVIDHLRFLFDNSIIGFKIGSSKEWRFKCFYPTQGFVDSIEYRVHEGLVRVLNLRENREIDPATE